MTTEEEVVRGYYLGGEIRDIPKPYVTIGEQPGQRELIRPRGLTGFAIVLTDRLRRVCERRQTKTSESE